MRRGIFLLMLMMMSFFGAEAAAFWGDDSSDPVSGLDVTAGFDVNTIVTVTGSVLTPPERKAKEQLTVMSVATPKGNLTVLLGPWWYWEKQQKSVLKDQELAITGSLAQGKDGTLYLFAQGMVNRSNGETVTLRSESGKPLWSREASGNGNGVRHGAGPRSGAAGRGFGMRGGRR